ncbi:MAG: FkbM family methyltransferase [Hyphomicrobiales bacterium]
MMHVSPFGTFFPSGLTRLAINVCRGLPPNWTGKRLAFVLRRIALFLLAGRPVDTLVLGANMRLLPYQNVSERRILFTPQLFDSIERTEIAKRVRDDFVFVDVGANIGGYSLFVGMLAGPRAKIVAIEPQPEILARLRFNIHASGLNTIATVDCAVSDVPGQATFFIDGENRGESGLRATQHSEAATLTVNVKTLLEILEEQELDHVDALKIDVEGLEEKILTSFFRIAQRTLWPKLLICENGLSRWDTDLAAFLEGLGYQLKTTTRTNLVFELELKESVG